MTFSENAANILLDLTLLNHCLLCRCLSQDVAVQCSCVSQELAEETSESLCMVVVKLDVLQQGKVIVRLLLVGAFTKYWLELQSDHNLLYDYCVQIGLRRRCNILSSSPSSPSKKLMAQSHTLQTPAGSAREDTS